MELTKNMEGRPDLGHLGLRRGVRSGGKPPAESWAKIRATSAPDPRIQEIWKRWACRSVTVNPGNRFGVFQIHSCLARTCWGSRIDLRLAWWK